MQTRVLGGLVLLVALATTACDEGAAPTANDAPDPNMASARTEISKALVAINQRLARQKRHVRVPFADYRTAEGTGRVGQRIFAFDRGNKRFGIEFVAGDPRRGGRTNITYLVDQSDGATHTVNPLANALTEPAIDRAMNTWEAVRCSKVSIDKVADPGIDPDITDSLLGVGELGTPLADITHAGWVGPEFFDALVPPDGSTFILAVTIPFFFTEDDGITPTDIDGDGALDYTFAEIFYNDAFPWGINAFFPLADVQGTSLHESGHGLGQAHFGKIFQTVANGKIHFAPFAVMNAVDPGFPTQVLQGTDIGGHCGIWASWPH